MFGVLDFESREYGALWHLLWIRESSDEKGNSRLCEL